jgi:hypothetical protein
MEPDTLLRLLNDLGCRRLFVKQLSPNDNSKNQIYLGGSFSAINMLPFGTVIADDSAAAGSKRARFKAGLDLAWLGPDGHLHAAQDANLILYPRYPEVRLSGLLKGVRLSGLSEIIASRAEGRWLFLATMADGRIMAHACGADDPCARWALNQVGVLPVSGPLVLREIAALAGPGQAAEERLMSELRRIVGLGWIKSKRLAADGDILPCEAQNCGGYTLEAEFGIRPNARAEPDFAGWEVKQFGVRQLERPVGQMVTLFTPEPDGGVYVERGVQTFVRRFGYADRRARADRLNFGGIHRFGRVHPLTALRLALLGWNAEAARIDDSGGGIALLGDGDEIAAFWSFRSLIQHWGRKHAQAVYIPSIMRVEPFRSYRYGSRVLAGRGADFSRVVSAISRGVIVYDPGIKMEAASSSAPHVKRRSQFRIRAGELGQLYCQSEWRNLAGEVGEGCAIS